MAFNWGQAGQGALGGATAGMSLGSVPGALIGGVGGLLLGGMYNDKAKSAEQMGLTQFDALSEAQKLMPSQAELNTQRNAFNASNNQNIDTYAKQLIASGMNPQQAYTVAQNKMSSNVNRFESSQQQALANQQRQTAMGLMPYQMQRQEDITNYDLAMQGRPSFGQQAMGVAGMAGLMVDSDTLKDNWTGWFNK